MLEAFTVLQGRAVLFEATIPNEDGDFQPVWKEKRMKDDSKLPEK